MTILPHKPGSYRIPEPRVVIGTVEQIAGVKYEKLLFAGASLTQEDIESIIIAEVTWYVGWADLSAQNDGTVTLDKTTQLEAFEWTLLEPCVLTACDLLQAQRVEAAQSSGSVNFGIDSSTALQNYIAAREALPRLAFNCMPFSIVVE